MKSFIDVVKEVRVSNAQRTNGMISIIIVTYNADAHLQACLNSIFNQKYADIEIIIIDGKSTDDTVKIIKENQHHIAYWESEKDSGVYDAMNKGILNISGKWVYFMGADDVLLPGFSDMVMELTNPSGIYYGNVIAQGTKKLGELTKYQFAKFGPYHQAIIYPVTVFDKYKFNTGYKISADFALTLRLCSDKVFHFVYKDYALADFNPTGLSANQLDIQFQKDKAGLIFDNFGLKTWMRYKIHKLKNRQNPRA